MSKFKKEDSKGVPAISTASLPDIVFMLLFFFMVTTVMRETTLKVNNSLPEATEMQKMEKKSLISYIYVGAPTKNYQSSLGKNAHIQLNGALYKQNEVNEIQNFIRSERKQKDEKEWPYMTGAMKADENVKNGIIIDIEEELRKAEFYRISYSTKKTKDSN